MTLRIIFWTSLGAILGVLAYRELEVVTVGFSLEPVYIPAKRSDVFRILMDEPEYLVMTHPMCTGVSNIVRLQGEDGKRIVEFDIDENPVLFGVYEKNVTFHLITREILEDTIIQSTADLLGGMFKIKQGYDLADAKDGRDGTLLVDHAEYTAPRILGRYVLREAIPSHEAITQNLRQNFREIYQKIKVDT